MAAASNEGWFCVHCGNHFKHKLVLTGEVFVDGNVLAEGYPHKKELNDESH